MKRPRSIPTDTVEDSQQRLILAVERFTKEYRRHPYGTKLNELRLPLLALKRSMRFSRPSTSDPLSSPSEDDKRATAAPQKAKEGIL